MTEVARNAAKAAGRSTPWRQHPELISPLDLICPAPATKGQASCCSKRSPCNTTCPLSLAGKGKADNQILGVVEACASSTPRAKWCWCPGTSTCGSRPVPWDLSTDDYQNDKTLEDFG